MRWERLCTSACTPSGVTSSPPWSSTDQHNTDSSVDESEVWIVAEWIRDCRTQDLTHVGQGEETHGLEDQEMVETQDTVSHESVVW